MKKRLAWILSMATALSLSACGEKDGMTLEDAIATNDMLTEMVVQKDEQIEQLNAVLNSLTGSNTNLTAISEVQDGTGRKTFNSIDGKILFPSNLEYPNSTQAPNSSGMKLSERVTIAPSDNWLVQMNGTTTKYSHPTGIYGTIKITTIKNAVNIEELYESALKPFIDSIPYTKCDTGVIHLEQTERGMSANIGVLNNEMPATLKCGVAGYIDTGIVYLFYYEGDTDTTKDELITNLIKTVKVGQQQLKVE